METTAENILRLQPTKKQIEGRKRLIVHPPLSHKNEHKKYVQYTYGNNRIKKAHLEHREFKIFKQFFLSLKFIKII